MKTISWDCPHCKKVALVQAKAGALVCPHCNENCGRLGPLGERVDNEEHFPEACPRCSCTQFYLVKDFNQALGCTMMLIAIVLVPKTYGLSLVGMWLIDLLLFKRIPSAALCYRCGAEFRGFKLPEHIKPFIHHIGVKYDRKRDK